MFNSFEKHLINSSGKINDYIKPNDTIMFDLNFTEYWLEVDMLMTCDETNFNISFEIKVDCNSYISNLKSILIKMGITSWAQFVQDGENLPDHYIYSSFSFDFLKDSKSNNNYNKINNNRNNKNKSNFSSCKTDKNIELDNNHGNFFYINFR